MRSDIGLPIGGSGHGAGPPLEAYPIAVNWDLIGGFLDPCTLDVLLCYGGAYVWTCQWIQPQAVVYMPSWKATLVKTTLQDGTPKTIMFGSIAYPYPPWSLIYPEPCEAPRPAPLTPADLVCRSSDSWEKYSGCLRAKGLPVPPGPGITVDPSANANLFTTQETNPNVLPLAVNDMANETIPSDLEVMPTVVHDQGLNIQAQTTIPNPNSPVSSPVETTTYSYTYIPAAQQQRNAVINPVVYSTNQVPSMVPLQQDQGGLVWLAIIAIAIGVLTK